MEWEPNIPVRSTTMPLPTRVARKRAGVEGRATHTNSARPRDPVGVPADHALFSALGHAVIRFRYLIVVAWLVAAVLSVKLLPSLSSASNSNTNAFLPANAPSARAAQLAVPLQDGSLPTTILVAGAGRPLTAADQTAIDLRRSRATIGAGLSIEAPQSVSEVSLTTGLGMRPRRRHCSVSVRARAAYGLKRLAV